MIKLILIFVMLSVILVSVFITDAYANVFWSFPSLWEEQQIFLGIVESVHTEWYDEPYKDHNRLDDTPTYFGEQHTIFRTYQFFKGTLFETIEHTTYLTSNNTAHGNFEINKDYLLFGIQSDNYFLTPISHAGYFIQIPEKIKNSDVYAKPVDFRNLLIALNNTSYDAGFDIILDIFTNRDKSPNIQQKDGILPKDVWCKEPLQLYFKKNTQSSSVCVKSSTIPKLVERSWGTIDYMGYTPNEIIKINETKNQIKYQTNGDYEVLDVKKQGNNLWIKINNKIKSELIIEVPREIINYSMSGCPQAQGYDGEFLVFADSKWIKYDLLPSVTSEKRVLKIPLPENTDTVKIRAFC